MLRTDTPKEVSSIKEPSASSTTCLRADFYGPRLGCPFEAVTPPSTGRLTPLTNDASSLARKAMTAATSSAAVSRWSPGCGAPASRAAGYNAAARCRLWPPVATRRLSLPLSLRDRLESSNP